MDLPRFETIQLEYPIQLADKTLTEVTMQRPNMKILRDFTVKGDTEITGEMRLFATLTNLRMEELEEMDAADYGRLQETFVLFRAPSESRTD